MDKRITVGAHSRIGENEMSDSKLNLAVAALAGSAVTLVGAIAVFMLIDSRRQATTPQASAPPTVVVKAGPLDVEPPPAVIAPSPTVMTPPAGYVPRPTPTVSLPPEPVSQPALPPTAEAQSPKPPADPDEELVFQIRKQADVLLEAGKWEKGKIGRIADRDEVFILKIIDRHSFFGTMAFHHVVFRNVDTTKMVEQSFAQFGDSVFVSDGVTTHDPDGFGEIMVQGLTRLDSEKARLAVADRIANPPVVRKRRERD
jgi:hypothetical protein